MVLNARCQHPQCGHLQHAGRDGSEGHYHGPGLRGRGRGPCKVPGCSCPGFQGPLIAARREPFV